MVTDIRQAILGLNIPAAKMESSKKSNTALYLTGGGFRGLGYVLLNAHAIRPYPISTINGFHSPGLPIESIASLGGSEPSSIFRISKRRASQFPAIQMVLDALKQCLPPCNSVCFTQGGIREGLLFFELPEAIQVQRPLEAATCSQRPRSSSTLLDVLLSAFPDYSQDDDSVLTIQLDQTPRISTCFFSSIIDLLYAHASLPKDVRASAALRCTTTGVLAGAHGLLHEERCMLGLVLCERWGGDVSPADEPFLISMQALAGKDRSWWAKYIGTLAAGVGAIFPTAAVEECPSPVQLTPCWSVDAERRTKNIK